jgi:hypothetical protein
LLAIGIRHQTFDSPLDESQYTSKKNQPKGVVSIAKAMPTPYAVARKSKNRLGGAISIVSKATIESVTLRINIKIHMNAISAIPKGMRISRSPRHSRFQYPPSLVEVVKTPIGHLEQSLQKGLTMRLGETTTHYIRC